MNFAPESSRSRLMMTGSYLADCLLLTGFALHGAGRLAIPYFYFIIALLITNIGRYLLLRNAAASRTRPACAGIHVSHEATRDALTGLANRASFVERVQAAVEDADAFAVAVLDLDRFRVINDSLGHGAGDLLLKVMAQRLLCTARTEDIVAHAAGDEFLILIRKAHNGLDVQALAARWMDALSEPCRIRGAQLHVSASIGIARYPDDALTGQELLARADEAMNHAKQGGRNRSCMYERRVMGLSRERLHLESELQQAIRCRQFELLYQPKIAVASGEMRALEALLRWQHPTRGRLLPGEFLSVAEDSGLLLPIGAWVIDEVCRQVRLWRDQGACALRVAINIPPVQFRQVEFARTLQEALSRHGLQPSCLELEICETTLMAEADKSVFVLEQLRRLGIAVTIADFGTGYSSMSYLQRFALDTLKIDSSFVRRLQTHSNDASIVRAIIALAHGLRLKVAASGVESAEQLAILKRMGCDQSQGSLHGAAVPPADIESQLAAHRSRSTAARADAGVRRFARLVRSNY